MALEDMRGGSVRHNVDNAKVIHRALKEAGSILFQLCQIRFSEK